MNIGRNIVNLARYKIRASRRFTPRFINYYSIKCSITGNNENLQITKEKDTQYFPLVWLRDNCRCENCYHDESSSRILNWKSFNVDVRTVSVEPKDDSVLITWEDGHKSVYDYNWLSSRSFTEKNHKNYLETIYQPPKKLWSKSEYFDILNVYQYSDVISNDQKFYNWLKDLAVYGFTLIKNAPADEAECKKLVEKVAFIRKTHYGEVYYIKNKPGTQNVAYLSSSLQLHTDLPYYDYTPGVTVLQCIVQTESQGGDSILADAFYVAEKMKTENRKYFDVLSKTIVEWSDIGVEDGIKFHTLNRSPVICTDDRNNVIKIRHSIPQRHSYFITNLENVKPWYRALKSFVDGLYENMTMFKLEPGDILAFDNTRLVHGRLGYKDTPRSRRFLVGMYLDWDEIYSAMRVVGNELKSTK